MKQPMSSTNATPPCSISSVGRTGWTRCSWTPPTFIVMPERSTNCFSWGWARVDVALLDDLGLGVAWPAVTPGLSRPNNWMPTP